MLRNAKRYLPLTTIQSMYRSLIEPYVRSCCSMWGVCSTTALQAVCPPSKNENKLDKDFYCTLHKFVLIRFIQRNQGHGDSVTHEFHSNVNKVNKAVAKVRTIGDRLP